jgi:hypothetical protein
MNKFPPFMLNWGSFLNLLFLTILNIRLKYYNNRYVTSLKTLVISRSDTVIEISSKEISDILKFASNWTMSSSSKKGKYEDRMIFPIDFYY